MKNTGKRANRKLSSSAFTYLTLAFAALALAGCGKGFEGLSQTATSSTSPGPVSDSGQPASANNTATAPASQTAPPVSQIPAGQATSPTADQRLTALHNSIHSAFPVGAMSNLAPNLSNLTAADIDKMKTDIINLIQQNAALIKTMAGANAAAIIQKINDALAKAAAIDPTTLTDQQKEILAALIAIGNALIAALG